jgi:diguanylate cyclase (GGDEF)-like protein
LQIVAAMTLVALLAANAQALLSIATDTPSRLGFWISVAIAAASFLLGLAAILMGRGMHLRLSRLTEPMLALVESCGQTATPLAYRGDEIDKLSYALEVSRENSRRAAISEANLKAAVENMVEGIVMISADGKVALHNQRLLSIFGLPPMNAVGLPRAEFNAMLVGSLDWPQSAQDYLQKQLAAVRADGQYRVFDLELPNNRVLRYSASMLADGNVMSYIEDISEQRAAVASILRLAHYDTLTELPNRTLFQDRLLEAVEARVRDSAVSTTLLLCDLDRFKAVNDRYGHPAGDELLRQAARRLRGQIRANDILARMGADEFAIISLSHGDLDGAERLAKRLVACLEQPFEIQGHEISVGISIGIANVPAHASSADEIIKQADLALRAAQRGGRNTHKFYDPAMSVLAGDGGDLEAALRKAIETGGLVLHYQPQVDLRTRQIVGFEALARWNHPERGAISPGVFIQLAEETGLVVSLGEWALRQACADALHWSGDITIAVNVAPQQLRIEGFVDMVRDVLAKSGLRPARLELEITESAPLHGRRSDACGSQGTRDNRRAHFNGRFWHRKYGAQLLAQVSLRQAEDRPILLKENG